MKIAFLIPSMLNRGPNVFTKNLVEGLINNGLDIKVYFLDDKRELEFNCDTHLINSVSDIDFSKYDIVHSTMFRPDVMLALNKWKLKDTKIVCGIHNYIKEDMVYNYGGFKGSLISSVWLFSLKLFDGIVFSSNDMTQYYQSKLLVNKYKVIPYGVPKENSVLGFINYEVELKSLAEKYFIIGAVGLLIKRKGFKQIIYALKELPNHALVLIGSGSELEDLKKLAINEGVSDRVLFLGFQQNSKKYYQYFDCYCMASYSEGFGLAMLDALSLNIPLVCCNLPIYREYFKEEYIVSFELDDIPSLVSSFEDVKLHENKYKKGSEITFCNHFSLDAMAISHINFYKVILSDE
ncbi:glycosyltransferase [Moritella dasanensis]|uniref:glycosyltransferase n=1 Tax=Moritella dasanensis TaxID=428031 RepID=UPI0002EFD044|nr:glycosyltransferase [Moritella dasanensis]